MDELERRVRAANPLTSRREDPLSLRAQDDLARLLAGAAVPVAPRSRFRRLLARARTRRFAIGGGISGLTVGAAVAVIAVAISLSTPAASWAVSPPPLDPTPIPGTVASVTAQLEAAAATQPVPDTSGDVTIRTQTWAIAATDNGPDTAPTAWIEPERLVLVRHTDGSVVRTFRVGSWDYGIPPGAEHRAPGSLIEVDRDPPGTLAPFLPAAPVSAADLQPAVADLGRPDSPAGALFDAIKDTARDWPTTGAAYLQALAATHGVRLDGAVEDRLGRAGIAFSAPDRVGSQRLTRTLIFDRSTGALLSSEVALTSGAKNLVPGGVINYTCWE